MASGRQFQSAIVCGKNEILKTSLFASGMRNLNWWLPLVRLSECWIKYFLVFISIRPWVSLYISVNLDCLLLVSSVAHPKSFIMSVTLAKTVLFYIEPFPERWYLSLTRVPSRTCIFQLRSYWGCICNFLHSLKNSKGCVVLYPTICLLQLLSWKMGCPLVLVTDGNPKVWEAINLFQLYTTEDIFSQGWIVLMWDGNNFAFGRIELHLPSVTDDCTLSGKSFIYNRNCHGPGTVPWGTPEVTGHWLDVWPSQTTDWKRWYGGYSRGASVTLTTK